ncbi:MAG: hypothetical protein FH762_09535 [Firmicutes bacterium]|nr:hypothetical protein [Bacillota bacterium]
MKDILSYGCRFDNLETEISIQALDSAGYETTLKKEFIKKISFDYYSNVYIIKGYYPNNDFDECFKGVELERWASLKNNREDAVKKVKIRWIRGEHVDREIEFNACAIKYKEEIDTMNHHFYLLLVDVDREKEIGYNNIITVNNSDLLYISMKPYRENESLNSVLRRLDNKYTSISDLKGNYALLDNLAKTKIATERSIISEEYWKMELTVSSLTTEFKSVFFELNINFNKAAYDGLVNNGRPLNILRRIISVLSRHISNEAIKDLDNIKKNLDTKKVLSSRQLKEKVKEIIKKEELIIQPRLNSIRVCKNNNGGGIGMSMNQGSAFKTKEHMPVRTKNYSERKREANIESPSNTFNITDSNLDRVLPSISKGFSELYKSLVNADYKEIGLSIKEAGAKFVDVIRTEEFKKPFKATMTISWAPSITFLDPSSGYDVSNELQNAYKDLNESMSELKNKIKQSTQ